MVDHLLKVANRRLTAGCTVAIFSATQLAAAGSAAFLEDMVKARLKLRGEVGNVLVCLAPPLLINGYGVANFFDALGQLNKWLGACAAT